MVQTRRAATKAARAQSTRSGSVPPARVDAQLQPAFGDRDVRLRSVAPNVREKEAQRRLRDSEEPAGRAGRNNCRLTGPATAEYNKGKRPWAFSKRKVGRAANLLCEPVVQDAWTDPEHIAEERRLCGDRNYVYPYTRKGKRVKGHCRKLSGPQAVSMEVALERQRRKNMQRELNKLVRKRDNAAAGSTAYQRLNKQVNELKAQLKPQREPVTEEPDDISQYNFRVTRPNNQPRPPKKPQSPEPAPRGRRVAGTRRAPAAVITDSMQIYIDSLPRGERGKARNVMSGYRNFGNMEPSEAIARYKQRKSDDARTPLDNAGEFEDELGTDDESDFEEPTGGALTMQMSGLMSNDEFTQSHPELTARLRARAGMSRRDEIAARRAELVAAGNSEGAARAIETAERDRIATAATQQYRRGDVWRGLAKGSQPVANPETPPGSPTGAGGSEALTQSFGGEGDGSRESTVPVVSG